MNTDYATIESPHVPVPSFRFSQAVRKGNLIQVSGQGGVDPQFSASAPENDLRSQTARALDCVRLALEEGGASLEDALMIRVYLTTRDHFAEMSAVYDEYVERHVAGVLPARTTVFTGLPGEAMLIEVDVLAVSPAAV